MIGDRFAIPPGMTRDGVVYQFASLAALDENTGVGKAMKLAGWSPVIYEPSVWDGSRAPIVVLEGGYIAIDNLVLMRQGAEEAKLSAEDARVQAIVLEAVARRSLGGREAMFDANQVRRDWQACKEAYEDVAFRNANRESIVNRAKRLARRAGQTPELTVTTTPPVPCRIEGFQLYFFDEERRIPIWRLFEPLAIVQVREEMASEVGP